MAVKHPENWLLRNNSPVGEDFLFRRDERRADGLGVGRDAELVDDFGFLGDEARRASVCRCGRSSWQQIRKNSHVGSPSGEPKWIS